jgi:integrase
VFASTESRGEAIKKRDAFKADLAAGTVSRDDRTNQTVAQFFARWLESIEGTRAPATYYGYAAAVNLHIKPKLGGKKLRALAPEDVTRFYKTLEGTPGMRHRCRQVLSLALNTAVKWREIPVNVSRLVDWPKRPYRETAVPSEADLRAFLRASAAMHAAGDNKYHHLFVLMAHTGMRPSELIGLEWRDVDLDSAKLRVERSRSTTNIGPEEVQPLKTERSRRDVLLSEAAVAALRAQLRYLEGERTRAGAAWADHGLVFPGRQGRPVQWMAARQSFHRAREKAKLPHYTAYSLRHAHVTIGLSAGVALQDMAFRTGHSVKTMLSVYARRVMDRDRDAAERVGRILAADPEEPKP